MAKQTKEFITAVTEAAAEGLHMSAIARKLGVTPSVVKYTIDIHKIKVKRVATGRGRVTHNERPISLSPPSPLRLAAVAEFNSGDSATVVAARLGVTRNVVLGQWNRAGLLKKDGNIAAPTFIIGAPPSLAMIRLAQHDPVIMRALQQRMRGDVATSPQLPSGQERSPDEA